MSWAIAGEKLEGLGCAVILLTWNINFPTVTMCKDEFQFNKSLFFSCESVSLSYYLNENTDFL